MKFDYQESHSVTTDSFPAGWLSKIRKDASLNSPLVPTPKEPRGFKYRVIRVIIKNPGKVKSLVEQEISGLDSQGEKRRLHLKKDVLFETSTEGAGIMMSDGSDCIAKTEETTIYIGNCFWLEGYDDQLRDGKFQIMKKSSVSEIWYHVIDSKNESVGWILRYWPFLAD